MTEFEQKIAVLQFFIQKGRVRIPDRIRDDSSTDSRHFNTWHRSSGLQILSISETEYEDQRNLITVHLWKTVRFSSHSYGTICPSLDDVMTLLSPNLALSQLSIRKTMASTAGK